MANTKTRKRNIDVSEDTANSQEAALRNLMVTAYKANLAKNEAANAEKKARAELLGLMKTRKLKSKILEGIEIDGKHVSLEALLERPEREKADVIALQKLVDKDLFLQIVSATKTDVINLAGKAVFEQIKIVSEGEENVTVKPLK